jgi:glycosyltransferase involved in cell wall biosynthesis
MTTPAASIIIPSYQSAETIRLCLDSLRLQNSTNHYEIIVVDSSLDSTPEIIRHEYPEVKLIHILKKTDPAAARNIGARTAQGEVLVFIDSDCVADPDWINRLFKGLHNGFSATGGGIRNINSDSAVSWAGYFCEFREFLPQGRKRESRNLTLGNAAYKKDAFWDAGAFPEGFFPQEDQVFHDQFLKKGHKINYDPVNAVSHRHRSNTYDFFLHQLKIGIANAGVVYKLGLPGDFLIRFPLLALMALPGIIVFRLMRTLYFCWKFDKLLLLRSPMIILLCAMGITSWGIGFIIGINAIVKIGSADHAISND